MKLLNLEKGFSILRKRLTSASVIGFSAMTFDSPP